MTDNTEKTFTIAGVSTQHGKTKQRFANGTIANRTAILRRAGCTDIKFWELPEPMSKEDARAWLEEKFGEEAKTEAKEAKVEAKAAKVKAAAKSKSKEKDEDEDNAEEAA